MCGFSGRGWRDGNWTDAMDRLQEIRFLFHELSNKLHIVLLKSGYRALESEAEYNSSMTREELLKRMVEMQDDFKKIEAETIEASELFKELKQKSYAALGIVLTEKGNAPEKD